MQINSKVSFLILFGILAFYSIFAAEDIFVERDYDDAKGVLNRLDDKEFHGYDVYLKYYLLSIGKSMGYVKLVPFLESIGVLLMTFAVTVQLAKRNISGLLAVIIVSTSNLFLFYDTSVAYDNSWTLFLLVAVYFSNRWFNWMPFVASIFCKPLSIVFVPSMLFICLKNKRLGIIFSIIGALGGFAVMNLYDGFKWIEFLYGILDAFYWMGSDFYMIIMIPIVMFMLVYSRRHHYQNTMVPFAFMLNIIISGGVVEGFTSMLNEAYRYVPLVVFFAIGTGCLLQKPKFKS